MNLLPLMWQVIDYDQVIGVKIEATRIFRIQAVLKEGTVIPAQAGMTVLFVGIARALACSR